jgi:acyl-[acyl carrier protein]--UDP-N-acetylglucosamine O-acyltransferase
MKRRGFEQGEINIVKQIIDKLFKFDDGVMTDRIESLSQEFKNSKVASLILEFVKQDSTRAFCEPKR